MSSFVDGSYYGGRPVTFPETTKKAPGNAPDPFKDLRGPVLDTSDIAAQLGRQTTDLSKISNEGALSVSAAGAVAAASGRTDRNGVRVQFMTCVDDWS